MMSAQTKEGRSRAGLRYLLWWGAGLVLLAAALLSGPTAWADSVICSGQSSIPIAPTFLKLVRGVEVTYGVGLCTTPSAPVQVTALLTPTGRVTVTPGVLLFATPLTQTVAVTLAEGIDPSAVFTVEIRHSTASADPNYDWGATNVPAVIAVYRPPLAVNDLGATRSGEGVALDVRANDQDRAAAGLTVTALTSPAEGVAVLNPDQTVSFTPTGTFTGTAIFTYTVTDGDGNFADGAVIVQVAPAGSSTPEVQPVNPTQPTTGNFSQTVPLAEGPITVTTEVFVPADAFPVAPKPQDILAILFTPVLTPTGPTDQPPGGLGGQGLVAMPLAYSHLTFDLTAMLNGVSLHGLVLQRPLILTVYYDQRLLNGLDEATLQPYHWTGSAWSDAGILVIARDPAENKLVFMVDSIIGELSFFARRLATTIHLPSIARDHSLPPWGAGDEDEGPHAVAPRR